MQDLNLPSLPDLFDLSPLLWAAGGVLVLFALYVLPLLACALLCSGRVGANADRQLDRLFGLFHALIDAFKHRGGQQ